MTDFSEGLDTGDPTSPSEKITADKADLEVRIGALAGLDVDSLVSTEVLAELADLQKVLLTSRVIDQAIGVIRGRKGLNAEEALAELRAISQTEHGELAVVAQRIIDGTVRRAVVTQPESNPPESEQDLRERFAIDRTRAPEGSEDTALKWWGCAAAVAVCVVAVLVWVGWATGVDELTRINPSWPPMPPWTAVLLSLLGVGVLAQSGRPSPARVLAGCGVAAVVGVLAVVFLAEYASGRSFGLDQVLFSEAVHTLPDRFPGSRPSPQTVWSVLLLSVAVALTRVDRRWARRVWSLCLAAAVAVPIVVGLAHLFGAESLILMQSTLAAVGLLLLVAAVSMARPDRNPVASLARPDRRPLVRMVCIIAGLPIIVGLSRLVSLALGVGPQTERVLSIAVGTVLVAGGVFYYGQREHRLLLEKEEERSQHVDVERRYRLMAENGVDIVAYVQGTQVVWISPSAEAAFGWAPEQWIGQDFRNRIHPEDLDMVTVSLQTITQGESDTVRARILTADGGYRWIESRGKPSVDADGNVDGMIFASRTIDDQIEAERQLDRLAHFDMLTGLVNRAETVGRLEAALQCSRDPGPELGVLFCDVDHFKAVNDTWGHAAGDAVLSTLATRINGCLRHGDTVGRTGGDEMMVLLPGVHNLDEVARIAEKIRSRAAEPIDDGGNTVHVTLSIGATLAVPGESAATLTARSDQAMYTAKRSGRDRITCA